ncbi:hypothetical protein [Marinoscillum furvescens]|uniref:Uncharacterized protein n=1 Tax=Marinoscillum furvescens DSM 4134 TaxID=1122208 RepID=A0A3D9L3Y4_MARFU|nr:hypothetical protein [Marinoscillum furvescens]RED98398.1 hypothetical protein C7460_11070 [Marinoscillum furvescens DSM 4134]
MKKISLILYSIILLFMVSLTVLNLNIVQFTSMSKVSTREKLSMVLEISNVLAETSSEGEDCSSTAKCSDKGGEPSGDGYDRQGNGPYCCGAMTNSSGNKKK